MKKSKVPDSPSTIYNNMSHHYRRLLGAKAVVDSSSPFQLKNRHLQSYHRASSTQSLNKLASCESARPGSCRFPRQLSTSTMSLYSKNIVPCPRLQKTNQNHYRKGDILDTVVPSSDIPPFKPRILKSSAESKLRQLHGVYFPPRKKTIAAGTQWETMDVEIETRDNLKPWLSGHSDKKLMPPHLPYDKTSQDMGSQCSTSSKDSAYNEGEGNSSNEDGSRGPSPGCKNQPNKITTTTSSKSWSIQKANRRTDALYVKFVRDITDDILNKGVYTNKGLKLVFQKHINDNMNRLNLNRMKEEVEKLGDKIGIPKNEEDDRIDFGLGSTLNLLQLTKEDQQILGTSGVPSATTFARAPTLSNLCQLSKSQTSSSSLDLEKELEALESYSDVELNEAEILNTLTMLNINPKLLENDTKSNAANRQKTRVDPLQTNEKDKNLEQNKAKFEIHSDPLTGTTEQNSYNKKLENYSQITTENYNMSNRKSSKEIQENTLHSENAQEVNKSEHFEDIDERIDSTHDTDSESDEDEVIEEPSSKSRSIELGVNKLNEINATLFAKKSQPENNKDQEIGEELEETENYYEDDYEKHSDESEEEEIEEDFNENGESGDENEEI